MNYYDYLTDFVFVEDQPEKADVIFIPGSRYGELAVHAAALYRSGYAPLVIPSGHYSILKGCFEGAITPEEYVGRIYDTEGDFFAAVLRDYGVPANAILTETTAAFTYENAIYSKRLMAKEQLLPSDRPLRAIIVCQAFHARRSLLYYQLVFPEAHFMVCPVETQGINRRNWYEAADKIDMVLGEVERCGSQFHEIMKKTDPRLDLFQKDLLLENVKQRML